MWPLTLKRAALTPSGKISFAAKDHSKSVRAAFEVWATSPTWALLGRRSVPLDGHLYRRSLHVCLLVNDEASQLPDI